MATEDWDALVSISPTQTIFQTYHWYLSWWQAIADEQDLFLICVKDNGRLIGLAPLVIVKKGRWRILKFMGTGHADYCDFLYDRNRTEILDSMVQFLAQQKDQWDAAALDYIPEESLSALNLSKGCASSSLFCRRYAQHHCPALVFDENRENVQAVLNKKSLKRRSHHFEKKTGFQVRHLTDATSINPYLDQFFEQHIQRRKLAGSSSLFLDEKNKTFYQKLVENMSSRGSIVFSAIESEGESIAFHFGFLFGERFIWYKPSFNPAYAKYSPGEVLIKELLTFALKQRCRELDFTIGDEAFKARFSNRVRKNNSYKIFQSRAHDLTDRSLSLFKNWFQS